VIRVLTVRQPWAWALIHGGKSVENRSRSLGPYRGPVLIQAGREFDDAARERGSWPALRDALAARQDWEGAHSKLPLGVILGVVDLVDAHRPVDPDAYGRGDCKRGHSESFPLCSPWAEHGSWHLVFENPRALDQPVPWGGGLGLRKAPQLELHGDWLVEGASGCTCHGPTSGPHEPGCGWEPVAKLEAVSRG
jgi:hypothetical protein